MKARISKAGTFLYSKRVKRYSRDIDIKVIIGPIITSAQEGMIHPAFVCLQTVGKMTQKVYKFG